MHNRRCVAGWREKPYLHTLIRYSNQSHDACMAHVATLRSRLLEPGPVRTWHMSIQHVHRRALQMVHVWRPHACGWDYAKGRWLNIAPGGTPWLWWKDSNKPYPPSENPKMKCSYIPPDKDLVWGGSVEVDVCGVSVPCIWGGFYTTPRGIQRWYHPVDGSIIFRHGREKGARVEATDEEYWGVAEKLIGECDDLTRAQYEHALHKVFGEGPWPRWRPVA